jgi:hypothetical protein
MLKVTEFNAKTGKTIVREMTENEASTYETEKANFLEILKIEKAGQAAKAADKAALLTKLGITDAEAKLLLS